MNVKTAANKWLEYRRDAVAASTVARDSQIFHNLPPDFLSLELTDLATKDLTAVVTKWPGSLGTKKRVRISLKAFSRWLADEELTSGNLGDRLPQPVVGTPPRSPRPLAWSEVPLILEEMHPKYRPLVEFAVQTGMRWGELAALTAGDVVLDAKTPHVVVSKSRSKNYPVKTPKSGKMRRIPLNRIAQKIAVEQAQDLDSDDLLFTTPAGSPLDHGRFYRDSHFKKAAPGHRFHDLRHTAAVHWLSIPNVDGADIQRWLGHKDLSQTQIYLEGLGISARDQALLGELDNAASY
ncbi:MAG: tyrosine-type recombinase/integrase [Scrofimicrobium sp.]